MEANKEKTLRITATEFKQHLGKYLRMAEDGAVVQVTRNGGRPVRVANQQATWAETLDSLVGVAADPKWTVSAAARFYGVDAEEVTDEMLSDYYREMEEREKLEYRTQKDLPMLVKKSASKHQVKKKMVASKEQKARRYAGAN